MLFFNTLIAGTIIAISSYSWFSMWMGLEINLLSIIPLLSQANNLFSSESALKYFITQALASGVLLFSIIMMIYSNEFLPPNSDQILSMMMNSALLTKMGAAPFHAWFPEVMEGLDWMNCLIMLTWQKIAPMALLMYNLSMMTFLTFIIIASSAVGGILGINQISMRKILTYSSINHIGWMIASMLNSLSVWMVYFLVYSIISVSIVLILKSMNIFRINQLANSLNNNKMIKLFFLINFLSLGGIPPFLGFFPKWITVNNLMNNNLYTLSVSLIILTLITLFFYLRLMFASMMINSSEKLVMLKNKLQYLMFLFNLMSLMGLAVCTLIFSVV